MNGQYIATKTDMEHKVYNCSALEGLQEIENNSIDTCITSPPYYQLRDYNVPGQIGLENTIEEYINNLVNAFREVRRVLKPDGTLWVNIADTYAGSNKGKNTNGMYNDRTPHDFKTDGRRDGKINITKAKVKRKNLLLIPFRIALALQEDGWIVRQDIIWEKTNCMPEAVKDRCTKCHEYIFLFSKQPVYYFNHAAIMEPCVGNNNLPPAGSKGTLGQSNSRIRTKGNNKTFRGGGVYTNNRAYNNSADKTKESIGNKINETGLRNKRSVWHVATSGYKGAHFATFPEKLIEPCILAGSKEGGTVLDIFAGSGTVAAAADRLGRNSVSIEINEQYCDLIYKRMKAKV